MGAGYSFTFLVIGVLGVWRVTHLFWGEDGPFAVFVRIRKLFGNSVVGQILDCFYCLSLWVAMPFAWFLAPAAWRDRVLWWLALSGGAILLERVTEKQKGQT